MKGIYNDSQLDYEEWSKMDRNPEIIDVELRSQKRRLFREKHATTLQFDWPEHLRDMQNTHSKYFSDVVDDCLRAQNTLRKLVHYDITGFYQLLLQVGLEMFLLINLAWTYYLVSSNLFWCAI